MKISPVFIISIFIIFTSSLNSLILGSFILTYYPTSFLTPNLKIIIIPSIIVKARRVSNINLDIISIKNS